MVQPATVGSDRARGLRRAEVWCNDCLHHAEINMDGLPDGLPVPVICLRYRCSKCGSKNLMSRGSIHEHYEMVEQQRSGKGIGTWSKPSS